MIETASGMLRNSEGQTVDPVPFFVVTGALFLMCYSFLPVYFLSFGVQVLSAVVVTTGVFVTLTVGAYSRLVANVRPELREEVPSTMRLQRIFYGGLVLAGVLLLLTLFAPV